jgi:hypothetical protein
VDSGGRLGVRQALRSRRSSARPPGGRRNSP